MRTPATFTALGLLILATASCHRSPPPEPTALSPDVVVIVAGRPVTRATFEKEFARRGPGATRESVLDDLIRFEATLAQVRISGFDRDPEIVAALERLLVARFEERELAAAESPVITDEEIRTRYAAEIARHQLPAAIRGGVLFLKSSPKAAPEQRALLQQRAAQLHATAMATNDAGFERLVREHSEDQATRYHRGDTGWLTAGQAGGWDRAVTDALWALHQPGDVAPLVEASQGYYLVRLAETRPASTRPLTEVAGALRHRMQQEKRAQETAAFHARMGNGLAIHTNIAALNQMLTAALPTAVPPSRP